MNRHCDYVTLIFLSHDSLCHLQYHAFQQMVEDIEHDLQSHVLCCLLVGVCPENLGSRCTAAIKRKHLTYIFMVLNNPEVLIKMKADIGMKDPPHASCL